MLLLSLDSSSGGCSACVWEDNAVLALAGERMERGQDARLLPIVKEAMLQAGRSFDQLDRIAVTRGPGSFTGLRIGLAAARGLGLAARKPVLGIDRFAIYWEQWADKETPLLIALESRRLELYTRLHLPDGSFGKAKLLSPVEIAALIQNNPQTRIVGDARDSLKAYVDHHVFDDTVHEEVVTCALLASRASPEDEAFLPRPLYLRAPDVTMAACKADAPK